MVEKYKFIIFAIIAATILVSDQMTKFLASSKIALNQGFELIPGVLNLVHVRNKGVAFGAFADSSSNFTPLALVAVSVIALVVILWLLAVTETDWSLFLGLSFFFGGTAGNLVDRFQLGEVIDFIDFHVGLYHWPAFNVADSALCIGAGLFFIHLFKDFRDTREKKNIDDQPR